MHCLPFAAFTVLTKHWKKSCTASCRRKGVHGAAFREVLLLQGTVPTVDVTLEVYQLLLEAGSQLRQPVALEEQLLKHNGLSSDVGKSMLQLLQVQQKKPLLLPEVTAQTRCTIMTACTTAASLTSNIGWGDCTSDCSSMTHDHM